MTVEELTILLPDSADKMTVLEKPAEPEILLLNVEEIIDVLPAVEIIEKVKENIAEQKIIEGAEAILKKIEESLKNSELESEYTEQIELFKSLKILSAFMPESQKNTFYSCKMNMMIDYLIQKMSGKPGLLATVTALLESGVLGDEYENQLKAKCDYDLGNELLAKVLRDVKRLAQSLEDKETVHSIGLSADIILEQIELKNLKNNIFQ